MKVLTFSKQFPKGHPKAGEVTHFVQKILHALVYPAHHPATNIGWPPKFHTIRAGHRFKPGDMASLRIWSGLPYRSKQIEFAQVEVKKVWEFSLHIVGDDVLWKMPDIGGGDFDTHSKSLEIISRNDGLDIRNFIDWFVIHPKAKDKVFTGQIICWSDKIEYGKPELQTEKSIG